MDDQRNRSITQLTTEDVQYFSDEHCISADEYLQNAKKAFYGKDIDVQFFIQNDAFEWKRKNIWTLGKIALSSVSEIEFISETLRRILNCYQSSQERLLTLEEENKSLKENQTRCTTAMERMVKLKLEMEKDLYKRFLLVLNSKKKKIRELEEALKNKEIKETTIFDAPTDPSGESEAENEREIIDIPKIPVKLEKRKISLKRNGKPMCKTKRIVSEKTVVETIAEPSSPKPSTSKDFSNAIPLDVVNLSSGGIVHVPVFVSQASTFLEQYIAQEGLFRKAGSHLRQKELMARLDKGGSLGEKNNAIDIANCLKAFFRNLPEPLIPYAYHDLFLHCVMLKSHRVRALLLACLLLPPHHLNTLAFFMEFLKKVSLFEKQNKMNTENLAKVIGPNLMPLQVATMSAVQSRLEMHLLIVKILIENAENIGVLPKHITDAASLETLGSTENELDVSESQSHGKSRKKKHRSGSLTRKPHLSASNLNLRMFNGLKKMVGKGGSPDFSNAPENQQLPSSSEKTYTSSTKLTKKRKVERSEPGSTKKKRVGDKLDKSKKLRLSLDRFVPKTKQKSADADSDSNTNSTDTRTERRWSSVNNSFDMQKKQRTCSNELSHLHLLTKNNKASNFDLEKEYNNIFIDANINLSDDSSEQVLLLKDEHIDVKKSHARLSTSTEELEAINEFSKEHIAKSKERLNLNNFQTCTTHIGMKARQNDQSEEYVRIPKSEYEEIKNRVSAIESRISQELRCTNSEQSNNLSMHSVDKVQSAYEKTLEEASIESTMTTDYLARKLGKELKIRRSGEHKIIRSPSARKIGTLRRRSQEKVTSKRIRRTASWHISQGVEMQHQNKPEHQLNNGFLLNERPIFAPSYSKEVSSLKENSTPVWKEDNSTKSHFINKQDSNLIPNSIQYTDNINDLNYCEKKLQSSKNQARSTVRRVSSFHGSEFGNGSSYLDRKVEKLKKTNSQQNIISNNVCTTKEHPALEEWRQMQGSWKDAERYFKSTPQVNTILPQTGRASIAKLRAQNAGMVLAKAKLFDECSTKSTMHSITCKKQEYEDTKKQLPARNVKIKEVNKQNWELAHPALKKSDAFRKQSSKNVKNKTFKLLSPTSPSHLKLDMLTLDIHQQKIKADHQEHISHDSNILDSEIFHTSSEDNVINIESNHTFRKENEATKLSPLMRRVAVNTVLQNESVNVYKADASACCKTPHIKKPLSTKTPKSSKALARRSIIDTRRTPLKAVGQLGTPRHQSPKSILKTRNLSRHA
ncbi:hypothetical protein KM043_009926 [Ampulex compressa]|nr:hypothetical protein KM043_009926 [Ampulex compressa]